MGASSSSKIHNPVNNDCPICKSSGKLPNIGGRFFIINETECQCNGCNTIFKKEIYYKNTVLTVENNDQHNGNKNKGELK
jgi:hypothetical protein